jgi:hypothetical protein
MPRYFFNTANGHRIRDDEGDLLADDAAARSMAVDILSEILPSQREQLAGGGRYSVVVADETAQVLYEITATSRRLAR